MNYNVTVIPGDGIGPEIVREARKVLDQVGKVFGHSFDYTEILMGGCSIDAYGVPLTEEALETARKSDAVLLGAVGGDVGNSRWYDVAPNLRPEAGLLAIRKGLGLFANIRPAYLYKELAEACPLKKEIIGDGFDMVIMRELTGGLYFGDRYTREVDGVMFICADHGNAEQLVDYETGEPFTAHTTNPVPFILVNADPSCKLREGGALCDIVPTLIELMGMEQPKEMTGKSLLVK